MPKSKRKFIEWVFKDEATNKEHQIQVYTLVENETVSFEAAVKHPERFTDRDENANVLKQRVLARCKEKRKLEWKPYILVTISHEGFGRDALNFVSCLRNYYGIGLLFEPFESAVLGDGTRIWRGISGKSYRFGPDAVPGWPTFGKTGRSVCRHFEDTPENRERLTALASMFAQVARGLAGAAGAANDDAMLNAFRLCEINQAPSKDSPCPEISHASSSEPPEPSAAATSAPPTASSSQVT
jgi:hypothetical protein